LVRRPDISYTDNMSTNAIQYESFTAFSPFSGVGPYRAADYWQLPESEPVELIEGRFVISPCPTPLHQLLAILLADIFLDIARGSGGIVLCAPMDVVLSDVTILQPDVLYIQKDRRNIVRKRIEGPPDIAIEILSAGTNRRDRVEKLDLYARYGVAEYWIVDPQAQVIEFLINESGRFVVQSPANERYQSPRLPDVEIQLADFWREVDERLPSE
jgi:Uma2 family endonuclease